MNRLQPLSVLAAITLLPASFCSSKSPASTNEQANNRQTDVARREPPRTVAAAMASIDSDAMPRQPQGLVGRAERIEAKAIYKELSRLYAWPHEDQYQSWRAARRFAYCQRQLKRITPKLDMVQRRAARLSDKFRELKKSARRISKCIHCDPKIPISGCHHGHKSLSYALHEVE